MISKAWTPVEGRGCSQASVQGCRRDQDRAGNKGGHETCSAVASNFKGHMTSLADTCSRYSMKARTKISLQEPWKKFGEYFAKNMKYAGGIMPLSRDLKNPEGAQPAGIDEKEIILF